MVFLLEFRMRRSQNGCKSSQVIDSEEKLILETNLKKVSVILENSWVGLGESVC